MPTLAFATFLIVCPTSFFLGVLFSLFPYDYPLLWSSAQPPPSAHLDLLEAHLKLLYNAPNLIVQIFHIVAGLGLLGLVVKLYKPTESNVLFDGGSLVLYMVAVVVYLVNTIKGLRIVQAGVYGVGVGVETDGGAGTAAGAGAGAGAAAEGAGGGDVLLDEGQFAVIGREDNLKVMSASNTILALVLAGVLVLQAGQWYAERSEEKMKAQLLAKEKEAAAAAAAANKAKAAGAGAVVAGEGQQEAKTAASEDKRQASNKEGKKRR